MTLEWEIENLNLLNEGMFRVTDPGPLRAPIQKFSIRRDEELNLILDTKAAPDATSKTVDYPAGTLRLSTEQVKLLNIGGKEALLTGVEPLTYKIIRHNNQSSEIEESALVHKVTVTVGDARQAAYTFEWLGNLPARYFIWPDSIDTKTEITTTRGVALGSDGITLLRSRSQHSGNNCAAKLTVAGQTIYVCAPSRGENADETQGGSIIYVGTPEEAFRRKVRISLSFALGIPLVELGHTVYDKGWWVVAATSRSAYNIARRIFDPVPMPLAPLTNRGFKYDLGRAELMRMMNALVVVFDELDLGNLSWAYWQLLIPLSPVATISRATLTKPLFTYICEVHSEVCHAEKHDLQSAG